MSFLIFSYLDGASLLNASLVSKTWNRRVFGESRLWETLRKKLGVDYGEEENLLVSDNRKLINLHSCIFDFLFLASWRRRLCRAPHPPVSL